MPDSHSHQREMELPWGPHKNHPHRGALLLRYVENKSLRGVSQALGASESAVQKPLPGAVEHLRGFFCERGVIVGASCPITLIGTNTSGFPTRCVKAFENLRPSQMEETARKIRPHQILKFVNGPSQRSKSTKPRPV